MTKKMMLISGVLALVLVVGLNVRHALNDYGVKDGNLHAEVVAQGTGTGGGTSSEIPTCPVCGKHSSVGTNFCTCPKEEDKRYRVTKGGFECTVLIGTQVVKGIQASCWSGSDYVDCPACILGDI